jgi:2-C-methyl-D-erythritol 4-phosphate cytidylyltransferase
MVKKKISVIIPAAGKGKRFKGEDKLLKKIGRYPVIIHTLKAFEKSPEIDEIVLVVQKKKIKFYKNLIENYNFKKVKKIVKGGKERQDSVYNGIRSLKYSPEFLIIHDGDRPFLKKSLLKKIIKELRKNQAVICGVPLKETVKEVENSQIVKTLKREKLWHIQTPQAFNFEIIKKAHQKAKEENFYSTDDSALLERLGYSVKIIKGSYSNIKITTYEDFLYAKSIYKMWNRL